MQNFRQNGDVLDLVAPYDVAAGKGAKVGSLFGYAKSDVLSGATGQFVVEGVVKDAVKVGSEAWAVGDKLYWDDSNKRLTKTSTAGMCVGYAGSVVGSGSGETTGDIILAPDGHAVSSVPADLAGSLTGTVDGTLVDVAATAGSCAGGSSPTAANVDTAIATAVASIVTGINTQNKELLTKINALLAVLR